MLHLRRYRPADRSCASHRFDATHDSWEPEDHVSVILAATFSKEQRQPGQRVDLLRVNSDEAEEEAEQLWAQCDTCAKWRRLPESMRDSDELDEAWTCAMHPDPARRGCGVVEDEEDEEDEEGEWVRLLAAYLESCGGTRDMVDGWHIKFETRLGGNTAGQSDKYFFDPSGKRFRSHPEIARHFKLKALSSSAASATSAHAADAPASTSAAPVAEPKAKPVPRAAAAPTPRLDAQLWAQCDTCAKWRWLPESMRDSDELVEAWTCAMHPDPARRECGGVVEEALGEDEVTTQVEVEEGSRCCTPACKHAKFHFGPCSCWEAANGGERKRRRSSLGEGMAALAASAALAVLAASVKTAKAVKIAAKTAANVPTGLNEKASQAEDMHLGRFVRLSLKVGEGGSVRAIFLTLEEETRLKRMQGNRESAASSRKRMQGNRNRKLAYVEALEAKVAALKASVHQLQSENHTLKQECSSTCTNAGGAITAALEELQVVTTFSNLQVVSQLGLKPLVSCPTDEGGADMSDAECNEGEGEWGEGDGSGDPLEQKRLKRMQRNRESAALSRNRKKAYIAALEAEVAALKASVHQLQSENHTLKQEYCSWTRN